MLGRAIAGSLMLATSAFAACDSSKSSQTPDSRYVLNGGTANDTVTGLTWQRCSVGQSWKDGAGCEGNLSWMTWDQAMNAGTGKWRLPTKDELGTLVAPTCKNPAINETVFPNMNPDNPTYWTSTHIDRFYWSVFFDVGNYHDTSYPSNTFAVRLVQSRP